MLQNDSPDNIILTLNRMTKAQSGKNEELKIIAQKLLKRANNIFSRKYEPTRNTISSEGKNSTIINHPVHIITKDKKVSPSAFIPFCEFGGDMMTMGTKIDQFEAPVCSSFQAKILNDQLCYEVDLSRSSNKSNIEREIELGFYFIMDYNEDRQFFRDSKFTKNRDLSMAKNIIELDRSQHATIYLNTIGKMHCVDPDGNLY